MTVNSGDPITTLQGALNAYTAAQEAVIAEAHRLKDPPPVAEPPVDITREGGTGNAVSSRY